MEKELEDGQTGQGEEHFLFFLRKKRIVSDEEKEDDKVCSELAVDLL